ncbi:HlyD family secretion protein [Parasynechococcus marenigrum]|jgi:hemolysin D|uniref:Possible effux transporter n=1 Tax=Parasynechococcus marenigrum (strain WH8102) TaxID=84588 RepID=Q7U949_PARMW|nr:HlyD family efflux transporter periplasmic adaptor subunit [Parasynechococcus marenigrum]CAE06925.1 possible effux transporter [Parasynechococcus marenigrum WH 8102]
MENKPWSFNQPVLLRKTRRNSSVLVWTLVGTTTFATLWAFLAPLPETVAVQGKLQPTQAIQDVEAALPGVVDSVLVQEGQAVKAGDLLLRFDPRETKAQLNAARIQREALHNKIIINRVLLGERPEEDLTPNQLNLLQQLREQRSGVRTAQREAEQRTRVRIAGLQRSLVTAETIAESYQLLLEDGATSELQALSARSNVDDLSTELDALQRELASLTANHRAANAGSMAVMRSEIEQNLRSIAELDRKIRAADVRLSRIELRASIDAVVFDITVSAGSVIDPNTEPKPLLKLVPQNDLQAKVFIPNDAIGFVGTNQRADISLNAFKASDFAYLPATVERVGSDALTPDEQRRELGQEAQGLYFPAVLKLQRQSLQLGQRSVPLQPGMSLTADIHLRDRRFISAITDLLDDKRRGLERMR